MDYLQLDEQLRRWQVGMDAAEFHGALCAHLICEGSTSAAVIAEQMALDSLRELVETDSVCADDLATMANDVRAQLDSEDLAFEPLLPESDAAVAERANALCAWVRGFLAGLAMSGRLRQRGLDEEGEELVADLGRIAGSELEAEDDESSELDLMEVEEFVRMGVLYLRDELGARAKPRSETRH